MLSWTSVSLTAQSGQLNCILEMKVVDKNDKSASLYNLFMAGLLPGMRTVQ